MSDRETEIEQYVKAYSFSDYKMGDRRRRDVYALIRTLSGTLLDVGTGRGETLDMCKDRGIQAAGIEVVPDLIEARDNVVYGTSIQIPFSDGFFDYCTCFDVFEHLIEEDLIPTVKEMLRVSKKAIFISASETPHVYRGRELHISKRPRAKWEELLREASGLDVKYIGVFGGSPGFAIHHKEN